MTRREEIVNNIGYQQTIAEFEYVNQHFDINKIPERNAAYNGFITGAEWMQKTMIEKACEWIIENMPHYVSKDYTYEVDMADDFRKAMEEQL
jgi:hypothetical protein